jgi:epoxyqueuosine reductase
VSVTLTETVKAEAHRLGFELVGVTGIEPPAHFPVFERWLELGRHGEMGYLAKETARQRRADPRQILPDCQSILVLGMRYPAAGTVPAADRAAEPLSDDPAGRVAAYAWGADYHDILPPRLRALAAFIEKQAEKPISHRFYTDTGPVLERDLAQRAGLGWIGKNTCLINPRQGSYFFLAEILLGIDLEPDAPFEADHCGTCSRCIEACPTQCILPDRTLDARRCISYLTIELKGAIPADMRQQMGKWVFGCDVCQQVCPWNLRFATPDGDAELAARPEMQRPRLAGEVLLNPQAFNLKFRGSPVQRAHRRGYLRNVATALGNSGSAAAIPALATALASDPEALVRLHAAWALGRLGGKAQLLAALASETDEAVLSEIRLALAKLA